MKRAVESAKVGVSEELEPVQERVGELIRREEDEPERGRFDEVREDLHEFSERAEGETRAAIESARERIDAYREERASG